jgi:hypothetical protein
MFEFFKSIFNWLTARQDTKTAQEKDTLEKDKTPNLLIEQMIAQITVNNFWLIAVETELALIVMWNILAYGFGWPLFKTEFDALQLLLAFCGLHVIKIGHRYIFK